MVVFNILISCKDIRAVTSKILIEDKIMSTSLQVSTRRLTRHCTVPDASGAYKLESQLDSRTLPTLQAVKSNALYFYLQMIGLTDGECKCQANLCVSLHRISVCKLHHF